MILSRGSKNENMKLLLIDNFDSFTFILRDYFLQLGCELITIRNNDASAFELAQDCDGIILSPGPDRPENAGILMDMVRWADEHQIPTFGVCLGFQAICEYYGDELVHSPAPFHGRTSKMNTQKHFLFDKLPHSFKVMRYHSLEIKHALSTDLEPIAQLEDGTLMAVAHTQKPIVGVQFHPESIETEYGLEMLKNWVDQIKKS